MKYDFGKLEDFLNSKGISPIEYDSYLRPLKTLSSTKRYGIVWEEPNEDSYDVEDKVLALQNSFSFLKEWKEKKISADLGNTNILIEGDNLHALKALQYTHSNSVDIIYIDPPYNTGVEFVYNDKIVDSEHWWKHSKWLSFMNKRLRLAYDLLKEDGVIFISIDDHEQANLKLLCDSIFHEDNFISSFVWQKKSGGGQAKYFYEGHEYVLIYCKNKVLLKGLTEVDTKKRKTIFVDGVEYQYEDDFIRRTFGKYEKGTERRCHYEDIEELKGIAKKEEVDRMIENKEAALVEDKKTGKHFVAKLFPIGDKRKKLYSILTGFWTSDGNTEIENLGLVFDNPKPTVMIKKLIDATDKKDALILDFFAGSGTTGQAVLELNAEDGGNRKFILCTNNEVSKKKEADFLVSKGLIREKPSEKSKTDTKLWEKELLELKETEEYKKIINTEEYDNLGICRSVTYPRLTTIISGKKYNGETYSDGIDANLSYFIVDLVKDSKDNVINTRKLINQCSDLISIKEDCFLGKDIGEIDNDGRKLPYEILIGKDKVVILVERYPIFDEDIEKIVEFLKGRTESKKIIYSSYQDFDEVIYNKVSHKLLPQEIIDVLEYKEGF